MTRTRWAWIAGALVLLLAANTAAEWEISRRLESRTRGSLSEGPGLRGDFEDISVCLPCLSYTLHELRLERRDAPPDLPILYARSAGVGADGSALLRGRWRGHITLHDAQLRVDVGGEGSTAFSVPWSELGRGLFPAPIARIEVHGSRAVLRHEGFAEPLEWAFRIEEGYAEHLAPDDGPPRVFAEGRTPGRGHFELRLEVGAAEGEPSRLRGSLRDVSLAHLESYLQQRVGVEVEGGQVSARIALEEAGAGWQGTVDCEVSDLQVFELRDLVEQSPLQATRDGLASVASAMRRSPDGVLRMQIEMQESTGADADDPWRAAARVLRWLALAPFTAPLELIEATTAAST